MNDEILLRFKSFLSGKFSPVEIDTICQALFVALDGCEIKEKTTELTVYEDKDLKNAQMFMIAKSVEGCTKRTLAYYNNEVMRFLKTINKPLSEITTNDIRAYIARMAFERNVSKTTQDNTLRILKSFFGWLTAEEIITKNPTLKIKKIKAERTQKKAFTELEVERLRVATRDKRERAIIEFLLSTGCRVGELVLLNKKDIRTDECTVFGKGEKERTVYLNAKAIVSLDEYLKERKDNNEALFVSMDKPHSRLKISGIEIIVRQIGRRAGINDVHPHRFRRTAATWAARRGMPIEQIKEMLGHADVATTMIYLDMTGDVLKENHKKYVI